MYSSQIIQHEKQNFKMKEKYAKMQLILKKRTTFIQNTFTRSIDDTIDTEKLQNTF